MSLSIGGINVPDSLINCEWRIGVLERLVERLIQAAPYGTVTPQMIEQIRAAAFEDLQKKYPDAGLTRK